MKLTWIITGCLVIVIMVSGCLYLKKGSRRQIIDNLKKATFALLLPDSDRKGMPVEKGTAFFISPTGYILTANHVVESSKENDKIILQKHVELGRPPEIVQGIKIIKQWPKYDLALLKADFENNKNKAFLIGKTGFDYLKIDLSQYSEGEGVYVYGYPLPQEPIVDERSGIVTAHQSLGPRLTSAMISSTVEHAKQVQTDRDTKYYVIDKSLHYGNSGGPVVLEKSGRVIAVCVSFQPSYVIQSDTTIMKTQSQYSSGSSLKNIEDYLSNNL